MNVSKLFDCFFFVILYKSLENEKKENQNRNIYLFKNINIFENLIFNLF